MKSKNLIYSTLILSILALSGVFIISCSDEENINAIEDSEISSNIMAFSNYDEYFNELKKVQTLSLSKLSDYENSKGYVSFGRKSEQVYSNIDFEGFKSIEELKTFVKENNDYLQLTENEDGELVVETILHNSPDRYFINKDKIFQIAGAYYKVFDNGIVSTSKENLAELISIENIETSYLTDSKVFFTSKYNKESVSLKSTMTNCGNSFTERGTNKKERIKMEGKTYYLNTYDPLGTPWGTKAAFHYLIRPYKRTLGVWYWCGRHVRANLDVDFTFGYTGASTFRHNKFYDWTSTSKLEDTQTSSDIGAFIQVDTYFTRINCWAETSATKAKKYCN